MLSLDVHLRRGSFERRVSIKDDARIIALDGRSGVGKTTVLHAIAGLLRPLSGRIEISDRCESFGRRNPARRAGPRVALTTCIAAVG